MSDAVPAMNNYLSYLNSQSSGVAQAQANATKDLLAYYKTRDGLDFGWRAGVQAFLTGLGAYKQYKLYDQQGDLAEAQMRMVDQQKELLLDQYNSITKPLYEKATDKHYGYYWSWGKGLIEKIAECGSKICEYKPDASIANRAMAQVTTGMNQIRLRASRSKGMYQSGKCSAITVQLAAIEAQLRTDAYSMAYRYEDTKKLQWDQFYWNKNLGTAQIAQNVGSQTANLMVQQGSQLQSVAAGITQLISTSQGVLQAQFGALGSQAAVYGSLGSIAGSSAGSQYGQGYGAMLANVPQMYGGIGRGAQQGNAMAGFSPMAVGGANPAMYMEGSPSFVGAPQIPQALDLSGDSSLINGLTV